MEPHVFRLSRGSRRLLPGWQPRKPHLQTPPSDDWRGTRSL